LGQNGKVSKHSDETRKQEQERFEKVLTGCRSKIDADSKRLVHTFDAKKKKLLRSIDGYDDAESERKLRELQVANVCAVIHDLNWTKRER
jgi:hypothetical protein